MQVINRVIGVLGAGGRLLFARPIYFTLRFVAITLLLKAGLTVLGWLLRFEYIVYLSGLEDVLFTIFLAWLLISGNLSRALIAIFLFGVFLLTITLILFPTEAIVKLIEELRKIEEDQFLLPDVGPRSASQYALEWIGFTIRQSVPFVFTLLMGALGASILVMRQFISEFNAKPSLWYVYRPVQGMLMALLVMYGIAGGMIGVGGQNPINVEKFAESRYLIGFLLALSGLFSEHAFIKLQEVSQTIFGRTPGTPLSSSGNAS